MIDLEPEKILELSEEELSKYGIEDLEHFYDICQYNEEFYHTQQLVEKIMINSLYGAVGKEFFPLFNLEMARAITGNGRYLVKNTANMIEEKLQELLPWDSKYVVYGDTDSCIESTLINTNKGNITIGDLYDNTDGDIVITKSNSYVKTPSEYIESLSVNKDLKIESKKIKYIMKHKVNKRMFKVKCNGKEVTITEDHSIMVVRNGILTECKPADIIKGDKLIINA